MHKNEIFMILSCMYENDTFMHENENFDPGMIFSPQKFPWVVELYTTSCMTFSPMNSLGKIFILLHGNFIFMNENFIFMNENFILMDENYIFI